MRATAGILTLWHSWLFRHDVKGTPVARGGAFRQRVTAVFCAELPNVVQVTAKKVYMPHPQHLPRRSGHSLTSMIEKFKFGLASGIAGSRD